MYNDIPVKKIYLFVYACDCGVKALTRILFDMQIHVKIHNKNILIHNFIFTNLASNG
mgnify:CR=1 FL=1